MQEYSRYELMNELMLFYFVSCNSSSLSMGLPHCGQNISVQAFPGLWGMRTPQGTHTQLPPGPMALFFLPLKGPFPLPLGMVPPPILNTLPVHLCAR